MHTAEFDYHLPESRIAQKPIDPRDGSRLLVFKDDVFHHTVFSEIEKLLTPNDVLIFNNARVLPVRLFGHRLEGTKGPVEALITKIEKNFEVRALLQLSAKIKPGMTFIFEPGGLVAEVLSTHEERIQNQGEVRLKFSGKELEHKGSLEKWLIQFGHVPLPPYIEREDKPGDRERYQTVYASQIGSAAAPTAGFHFTPELLKRLTAKGIGHAFVTLHVGIGTFRPMKAKTLEEHEMHRETYEITPEFISFLSQAKKSGKKIIAVGTTVVRALESWAWTTKEPGIFSTDIFIKPGFRFQMVDSLITNFHQPRSTLLVLIAAAMGLENQRKAYEEAMKNDYRFLSYGDAMFISEVKSVKGKKNAS